MENNAKLGRAGWVILFGLSFIPAFLWFFEPFSGRFSNFSSISTSLGDIAGLTGMAMFSLNIILSARFKFFEKIFRGINGAYVFHHFFGGIAFILLLMHPLALAGSYLIVSFKSAAIFLLPGSNIAQNLGFFGLAIMILALVITFYLKIKYQNWKLSHKFLGLAFLFAFFHVFLIGADISSNLWLKLYLLILGLVAIAAFVYRSLLSFAIVKTFKYTVSGLKTMPDGIHEIELLPDGKEMKFRAGQFAFVKFFSSAVSKEIHPFSMSSANGNPLKFGIKESGDYTKNIGKIKPGDRAKIEGPFGIFNFRKIGNKKQIWIAGGVGVTPFLSMLRSIGNENGWNIDFYYSVKNKESLAFKEEMEDISRKHQNVKLFLWVTEEKGFIGARQIVETSPDFLKRDILICGPAAMMTILKNQFLGEGLKKDKLHTEDFKLY